MDKHTRNAAWPWNSNEQQKKKISDFSTIVASNWLYIEFVNIFTFRQFYTIYFGLIVNFWLLRFVWFFDLYACVIIGQMSSFHSFYKYDTIKFILFFDLMVLANGKIVDKLAFWLILIQLIILNQLRFNSRQS